MKIVEYQLDELKRARELQNELCDLHVPSPVLSWSYEVRDKNGKVKEKGIGKANSFVRNALNVIAFYSGCAAKSILSTNTFGNGIISLKDNTGAILNFKTYESFGMRDVFYDPDVIIGTATTAESLDSYALTEPTLVKGSTALATTFNATSKILTTVMSRLFTNNTGSSMNITEAGVYQSAYYYSSPYPYLLVRDLFTAIALADGESIVWNYTFEVSYPS